MRVCDLLTDDDDDDEEPDGFGTSIDWFSLKYNFLLRGGKVLLSRSANIRTESLSGDEERSGDSGDERGGVNSNAASTQRTRFEALQKYNNKNIIKTMS